MIAFQHRLDIQTRTSTEDRYRSPTPDIFIDIKEILLILKEVILRTRLPDINQVIWN